MPPGAAQASSTRMPSCGSRIGAASSPQVLHGKRAFGKPRQRRDRARRIDDDAFGARRSGLHGVSGEPRQKRVAGADTAIDAQRERGPLVAGREDFPPVPRMICLQPAYHQRGYDQRATGLAAATCVFSASRSRK